MNQVAQEVPAHFFNTDLIGAFKKADQLLENLRQILQNTNCTSLEILSARSGLQPPHEGHDLLVFKFDVFSSPINICLSARISIEAYLVWTESVLRQCGCTIARGQNRWDDKGNLMSADDERPPAQAHLRTCRRPASTH